MIKKIKASNLIKDALKIVFSSEKNKCKKKEKSRNFIVKLKLNNEN